MAATIFMVISEGKASKDFVGSFQAEIDRSHWLAAEMVGGKLYSSIHTCMHTHARRLHPYALCRQRCMAVECNMKLHCIHC